MVILLSFRYLLIKRMRYEISGSNFHVQEYFIEASMAIRSSNWQSLGQSQQARIAATKEGKGESPKPCSPQ